MDWRDGNDTSKNRRVIDVVLEANVKTPDVVKIKAADADYEAVVEVDENTFADSMIEGIVRNHGDINNVMAVRTAKKELTSQIAYQIWKNTGAIYEGLTIPGFGYIEAQDPIAVVEGLHFDEDDHLYAIKGTEFGTFGEIKGRLHFLPEGTERFLVFDLSINGSTSTLDFGNKPKYRLDNNTLPSASKEFVDRQVPGPLSQCEDEKEYNKLFDKTLEFIREHMGAGNDRRVELEDDLIF